MAIITKGKRLYLDYRPDGRWGKRLRPLLPEGTTIEEAKQLEQGLKKSKREFKAQAPATTSTIVDELFPEYLQWYKLHRAATTYDDLSLIYEKNISRILGKQRVTGIGPEHFTLYQGIRKREQAANDAKRQAVAIKQGKPHAPGILPLSLYSWPQGK